MQREMKKASLVEMFPGWTGKEIIQSAKCQTSAKVSAVVVVVDVADVIGQIRK